MKKRATKEQPEVPLEMRRVLMDAFKSVGGQAKFDAWAKRHPTMLYNMLMKLVPSMAQVAAQVDVHATIHDGDEARQKLQSAFHALCEAARDDAAEAEAKTGIRIIDGVQYARIADQSSGAGHAASDAPSVTQDDTSPTRLHDDPKRATDQSARGTGHGATDDTSATRGEGPSPEQNENISNLETEGSLHGRGLRRPVTGSPRPGTAEPVQSTTARYLEWANNGGLHRTRWDNNQ
jgi:hypothetical protein